MPGSKKVRNLHIEIYFKSEAKKEKKVSKFQSALCVILSLYRKGVREAVVAV